MFRLICHLISYDGRGTRELQQVVHDQSDRRPDRARQVLLLRQRQVRELHHHVPVDHALLPVVVLARRPPRGPAEEPPRPVAERGVALEGVRHDALQGGETPVGGLAQGDDGRERPVGCAVVDGEAVVVLEAAEEGVLLLEGCERAGHGARVEEEA